MPKVRARVVSEIAQETEDLSEQGVPQSVLADAPTFDQDGYPTEKTLDAIRNWHIGSRADCRNLLEYARGCWKWSDWAFTTTRARYYISTGGWSGNEDILDALAKNRMFWMFSWQQSKRGGHYIFEVGAAAKKRSGK